MGAALSQNRPVVVVRELQVLTGKVVIVTGGNAGIGYETVKILARQGAKVYMAARNESKATGAITQLENEGLGELGGQVVWLKLDLDDPRTAVESAKEFLRREQRLDILVNNAAQLVGPFEKTADGISRLMVVNHVAPFAFTNMLLPLMIKTSQEPDSDVRVVFVASDAHRFSKAATPGLQFSVLEDLNQDCEDYRLSELARYCMTKLTNVLTTRGLQKHLDEENASVMSLVVHPGAVNTFSDQLPFPTIARIFMKLFFKKPEVGAYTPCLAAASPLVRRYPEVYRGAYLKPFGSITAYSGNAARDELVEDLWALTERVLHEAGVEQVDWRTSGVEHPSRHNSER